MAAPAPNWSTQQLVEFLAVVSERADRATATQTAVEQAAEAFEADVAAVVRGGRVVAATGFPSGAVPVEALVKAVAERSSILELPWDERCACVSVALHDDPTERLLLGRDRREPFSAQEVSLLRGMARVLDQSCRMIDALDHERTLRGERDAAARESEARATENEALLRSLQERQRLLERLSRIQRSIVRRAELADVLDAIVVGARELLGDEISGLRLLDRDDPQTMIQAAASGFAGDMAAIMRRTALVGAAGQAIREDRLIVVDDYASYPYAITDLSPLRMSAALAAPVHENGRVSGALTVLSTRPGRRYSNEEQEVLLAFAETASIALTDARNFEDSMRQALYDSLTGLPNRAVFLDRLRQASVRASRHGLKNAVLFLDLDHFKAVNDTLGHPAGDELLRLVAGRLDESLRAGDTAARFGGDEFAVLLEDATGDHAAAVVAKRILRAFERPFEVVGQSVRIGASIGIVEGHGDPDDLLRNADLAMYQAKGHGRSRYEIFEPAMRTAVLEQVQTSNDLRDAIDNGELRLHFQPIVALDGGALHGLEALVRWQHPVRGLLPPAAFIELAEETGQIVRLGRWVLREACQQAARWAGPDRCGVAVNLSAEQLSDPALVDDVAGALADSGVCARDLTLEITESVLISDSGAIMDRLRALKELGVRLAIDDFGTGYSSLQYLRRFPIDVLKIPKPFVDPLGSPDGDATLARAIVYLARSFGLGVVAEGIECEMQRTKLLQLGCTLGQGYLFARPLEPDAAVAWLDEQRAAAGADLTA